jgi:hypothetical protein
VAADGDYVVVGANHEDEAGLDAGAAYVFQKQSAAYVQEKKLLALPGQPEDTFGWRVAIESDVLLVSALGYVDPLADGAGAVFVFRHSSSRDDWIAEDTLITPNDAVSDDTFGAAFGYSIATSGPVTVIGAIGESSLALLAGAAYVFRYDGATWVQEQKLLASDGGPSDGFGGAVAIAGDWILVGATGADGVRANEGAVYAFRWNGRQWIEEQKLIADDPGGPLDDDFGWSVSLTTFNGGTAIIGDHRDDDFGFDNGSAYIFSYDGTQWLQAQELSAVGGAGNNQQFGRSVSIDDDRAIVGAPFSSITGSSDGAAYVFRYDPNSAEWVFQEQLLPEAIPSTSFFGYSVAISDGTVVCGAYGEFSQSGRAYVFNVAPGIGDLDCDGVVDSADLAQLLAQWGPCAPSPPAPLPGGEGCLADFTADGVIDAADLAELLANWG